MERVRIKYLDINLYHRIKDSAGRMGVSGNCARQLCVLYLDSAGSRDFVSGRLRVLVSSRAAGGVNYEQDVLGYKPAAMD